MCQYKNIQWYQYKGVLLPSVMPHQTISLEPHEQRELLAQCGPGYFTRYITQWDQKVHTEFWYVIKDTPESLESYKSKVRNQIKKGLKNTHVRRLDKGEVANQGYEVYRKAFGRYMDAVPTMNREQFRRHILDTDYEYWGVFSRDGMLIAYAQNWVTDNVCSYGNMKFDPDYLNLYGSYALIHTMNHYYLNEQKKHYVSDGARSIYHDTNIQELLIRKFHFRKAYCSLKIVYRRDIRVLITILYPFRKIFQRIQHPYLRKINTLLTNEWIARNS